MTIKTSIRYRIDTLLLIARTTTDERLRNELCLEAENLLKEVSTFPELMDPAYEMFRESQLRHGVKSVVEKDGAYVGGICKLRQKMERNGFCVHGSPQALGKCLSMWQDFFLQEDDIRIDFIANGTGGRKYHIFREGGK